MIEPMLNNSKKPLINEQKTKKIRKYFSLRFKYLIKFKLKNFNKIESKIFMISLYY